jgi:hypothetical protein
METNTVPEGGPGRRYHRALDGFRDNFGLGVWFGLVTCLGK